MSGEAARESVGVFVEAWKLMVGRFPGAELIHAGGVSTCLGNVPLAFFNVSIPDGPLARTADLRAALHPPGDHSPRNPIIQGCRYDATRSTSQLAMRLTGMGTDRLLPARRPSHDLLEWRRVTGNDTGRDLATVNRFAYGTVRRRVRLHVRHEPAA